MQCLSSDCVVSCNILCVMDNMRNETEYNVKSSIGGAFMKEENSDREATYIDNNQIPIEVGCSFYDVLKRGIYKELHRRKMLSDGQLCILLKTK